MTQPPLENLDTIYTRALRLLGLRPPNRQLRTPLTVQSVQVVADASDFSIPHSNPVFGLVFSQPAVALRNSCLALQATSRLLRVRQLFISTGTGVRWAVMQNDPIDTNVATRQGADIGPLGPFGAESALITLQGATAIATTGHNAARNLPTASAQIEQTQFDVRPPLLLARGSFMTFEDATVNTLVTVMLAWEEIPNQDEVGVGNIGFPEASTP